MTGNPPDLPVFAGLARAHDALLYLDDAHGFGVIGQRSRQELSPYGVRGNGVVRHLGESYDHIVLTGGFSKAYSSLLAFIACPTALKRLLKVAAPPYLYSGPSPTASLASALVGLQLNDTRGDQLRAILYARTRRVLDHLDKLGAATPNTSGFPIIEVPLQDPDDLPRAGRFLLDHGIYATLAFYPGVLPRRAPAGGRLPPTAHRRQHRHRGHPTAGRPGPARRHHPAAPPPPLTPQQRPAKSGIRQTSPLEVGRDHPVEPAPDQASSDRSRASASCRPSGEPLSSRVDELASQDPRRGCIGDPWMRSHQLGAAPLP